MNILQALFLVLTISSTTMCKSTQSGKDTDPTSRPAAAQEDLREYHVAYFASGCFWCVEAVYESVKGVKEVISGYAGGTSENPTYEAVGSGRTGHAEAVAVYYDSTVIDFPTLVDVYYGSQDPTTIGQRPDFGSQYRSIIFYETDEERQIAESKKADIAKEYDDEIVTEISPLTTFYEAEAYHQDFEKRNPNQRYVQAVSIPRLKRFQSKFPDLLKADK